MEAVRVADRDRNLTNANSARIAKPRPRERHAALVGDPHDRQVRVGVLADEIRAPRPAVRQDRRERLSTIDDVIVGQRESVRGEDDAGSACATGFNFDHRGSDRLDGSDDGLRIRVEQLGVVWSGYHRFIVRGGASCRTTRLGDQKVRK